MMTRKISEFECRSWKEAVKLLGDKTLLPLGGDTELFRRGPNDICLRLHGHAIVEFRSVGCMNVDHRGFMTKTTMSRINRCLPVPFSLFKESGKWFLYNRDKDEVEDFLRSALIWEPH